MGRHPEPPAAVLVSTDNGRPLCFVPTRSCTLKSKVQTGHTVVGRQLGKWHHKGDRSGVLALTNRNIHRWCRDQCQAVTTKLELKLKAVREAASRTY